MATYNQTPPVATPPAGTRSRGSSGASMNKYHPDNYLAPNSAQYSAAQGGYFPQHDQTRPPMPNQSLSHNHNAYQQQPSHYPPSTSNPAYGQPPQPQQPYSGPQPYSAPLTPYNNNATAPQNPPYPTSDPWSNNAAAAAPPHQQQQLQSVPQQQLQPQMSPRRASTSSSLPQGYPHGHRPQQDHYYGPQLDAHNNYGGAQQNDFNRPSSSGQGDHYRRSSSTGRVPHHRHNSSLDNTNHKHHHHHHHHDDDLKRYDTHRPTVGDTMYSMIGVVKDYLGPVHRE